MRNVECLGNCVSFIFTEKKFEDLKGFRKPFRSLYGLNIKI